MRIFFFTFIYFFIVIGACGQRTAWLVRSDIKTDMAGKQPDPGYLFMLDSSKAEIYSHGFISWGVDGGLQQELFPGFFICLNMGFSRSISDFSINTQTPTDSTDLGNYFHYNNKSYSLVLPVEINQRLTIKGISYFFAYAKYTYGLRIGRNEKVDLSLSPEFSDGHDEIVYSTLKNEMNVLAEANSIAHTYSAGIGLQAWMLARVTMGISYCPSYSGIVNSSALFKPPVAMEFSIGMFLIQKKRKKMAESFDKFDPVLMKYF